METKINSEYQKYADIIQNLLNNSTINDVGAKAALSTIRDFLLHMGSEIKLAPNVEAFRAITTDMCKTYAAKNHDYGDSFNISLNKYGLLAALVRMGDKMNRLEALSKNPAEVKTESIQDTLLDLANYSIMTIMWLKTQL